MNLEAVITENRPRIRRRFRITSREADVLCLLSRGIENAGIAAELGIAEKTVKEYLTRVYYKLGVQNRTQAVVKMFEYCEV